MTIRCLLLLLALASIGCVGDPIGDPCVPETVPEGGFLERETYVETNSPQCETRLCVARGLRGDPRAECVGDACASDAEVREHVYCTSRCAADEECPEAFRCEDLAGQGGVCVR